MLAVTFRAGHVASLAGSADRNRLIVAFVLGRIGRAYTVQLSPSRVRELGFVLPDGISRDGRTLLVGRAVPSDGGVVETIPFGGGRATRVASGEQAAWNG